MGSSNECEVVPLRGDRSRLPSREGKWGASVELLQRKPPAHSQQPTPDTLPHPAYMRQATANVVLAIVAHLARARVASASRPSGNLNSSASMESPCAAGAGGQGWLCRVRGGDMRAEGDMRGAVYIWKTFHI